MCYMNFYNESDIPCSIDPYKEMKRTYSGLLDLACRGLAGAKDKTGDLNGRAF